MTICERCREEITHDGEMWTHVRTGTSAQGRSKECHPPCRECDREGTVAIGSERFDGSCIRFFVEYFLCADHAKRVTTFERT